MVSFNDGLLRKVEQTIARHALLASGDTVVAALSGGADSCALLSVLVQLAEKYRLKTVAAHFNHGLRGSFSDADEDFCRKLAEGFGLSCVVEKLHDPSVPRGTSPEDYFRRMRYRFLDRVAADVGATKIALGHQLQDQAETVLLNILRGSGLDGLKGIAPVRDGRYIRPLLDATRAEILVYLSKKGLTYRDDQSNESPVYLRNRIREELMPLLKKRFNPRIEQNLARMAQIVRRDDDFIAASLREAAAGGFVRQEQGRAAFSVTFFRSLHESLRFRLIKELLERTADSGAGFSFAHIAAVADLALARSPGGSVSLPGGLGARREYETVVIEPPCAAAAADYAYPVAVPGTIDLRERGLILSFRMEQAGRTVPCPAGASWYFDADKIREPLVVRNRRPGDRFEPLGTKGSQKIKKLMIDRKIPRAGRQGLALLADRESVIWIENLHVSERVKVRPETKTLLVFEVGLPARIPQDSKENI